MQDFVSVGLEQHACCASIFSPADDSEHQSLGPSLSADQACGFPLPHNLACIKHNQAKNSSEENLH